METKFRPVILESPLAGKSRFWPVRLVQVWLNKRYACACARDCLLRGDAPFASHLIYAQGGILDDTIPEERARGINAGFAWHSLASASVVYIDRGVSSGMKLGIKAARDVGIPREYRMLKYDRAVLLRLLLQSES
jgi:hypothetical protein